VANILIVRMFTIRNHQLVYQMPIYVSFSYVRPLKKSPIFLSSHRIIRCGYGEYNDLMEDGLTIYLEAQDFTAEVKFKLYREKTKMVPEHLQYVNIHSRVHP